MNKAMVWFVLCVPVAASAADTIILPGLYESVTVLAGSPPEKSQHCVTPAEAAKGFDMPAPGESCKTVRNTFAGGKIDIAQTCNDSNWSATGSYTATGFVMDGKLQGKTAGQSLSFVTHTTGKRIAATCKPDND